MMIYDQDPDKQGNIADLQVFTGETVNARNKADGDQADSDSFNPEDNNADPTADRIFGDALAVWKFLSQ